MIAAVSSLFSSIGVAMCGVKLETQETSTTVAAAAATDASVGVELAASVSKKTQLLERHRFGNR